MLTIRTRLADERGATFVLMVLLLVVLLGMAGLVVDLGLVRADKQRNKSAADVAVNAGLKASIVGGGQIGTYQGACAAKTYLQANHPELGGFTTVEWTNGSGAAIPDPCTVPSPSPCSTAGSPAARATFAWFRGVTSGGLEVHIKAGYDASDMTADGFADEAYHADRGATAQYGCDQLAVIVKEPETAGLGKVLGVSALSSRIRSVGRVTIGNEGAAAVGLLLLERTDCRALWIQGNSGARAIAQGFGGDPGYIHADSDGLGANCGKVVYSDAAAADSIYAEQAETPPGSETPGSISVTALLGAGAANAYTTNGGAVVRQGTTEPPFGRGVTGRGPVDTRYRTSIIGLRSEAETMTNWTAAFAAAPAQSFTVVNCDPTSPITATRVFVDCPGTFNGNNKAFTGTDAVIVFNGSVQVTGGDGTTLEFRDADKVYVKGSASDSVNSVYATRNFVVNRGTSASCASRALLESDESTRFVIVQGNMLAEGNAAVTMCQTMLYLADSSGADACPVPSFDGAAPDNNTCRGRLRIAGSGGLDWSAPNVSNVPPTPAQLANFEDLALWSETSGPGGDQFGVLGGGTVNMKGVFFLPNANAFRIGGGGTHDINRDAQFISRKLEVAGNAVLSLRPNPANSVLVPVKGGFSLVR